MEKRPLEANSRWTRNTFVYYGFNNSPLTEQVGWISKSCDPCLVQNWAGTPFILLVVSCCSNQSVQGNVKLVPEITII